MSPRQPLTYTSFAVLYFLFLASTPLLVAQSWTPIQAKHRRSTYRIDAVGQTALDTEHRGVYLRSSTGSVLETFIPVVNGRELPEQAVAALTDSATGNVFVLSYQSMTASLETTRHLPLSPRQLALATVSGEATVNGLRCLRRPVMCVDSFQGPQKVECGHFWHSPDYDLIVRIESDTPLHGGSTLRIITENYDIQIGVEPDPAAFQVPSGFRIVPGRSRQ